MEGLSFKFALWVLVIIFFQMNGCRACLKEERKGLLGFKAFVKSNCELYDNLDSWVEDGMSDCCGWDRVKCNSTSRRVVDLSLNRVLSYSYPKTCSLNLSMFYPFEELLSLDLSSNWFYGSTDRAGFERAALTLKKLQVLDLCNNDFNSSILSFINVFTSLKTLILCIIPSKDGLFPIKELANLKNLETLDISGTKITALSMEGFDRSSSFKNLKVLDLAYTSFNMGCLSSLSHLISLKTLILSNNKMNGSFPFKELADLQNLEILDVSHNQLNILSIEGFERLSSLKKVKVLDLDSNNFNNNIWSSISNLVSLKILILKNNRMVGQFPSRELADLKNLETLDMSDNLFEGMLSMEVGLCGLKSLVELGLSNNQLSGPLPQCLGNLSNLQFLDLSSNHFSGNMESIVSKLTSIKCLFLSGNNFEGSFSFSALANHSKLEIFQLSSNNGKLEVETENPTWFPTFQLKILDLSNCHLNVRTGTIPKFLLYQYGMKFIDLSHNKLVGAFPSWILQNNSKLQIMNLMNNSFTGTFQLPNFIHDNLAVLEISSNNVKSQLPKEFGLVLSNLQYINISRNDFHGDVPSSIGELTGLVYMDLSTNNFSGSLPGSMLVNFANLQALYLSNNNFNGMIGVNSSIISTFLFVLDISKNKLSGTIPIQLCNLRSLRILDLSENRLFGSLPSCFSASSLQFLFLQKNNLSGPIPHVLSRSPYLMALDLRDNKFTGNIPSWINQLSKLRVLSLGGNALRGHIPNQLCQLRKVSIIDISCNLLFGSIPSCFNNMSFANDASFENMGERNFEYVTLALWMFYRASLSSYSMYNATMESDVLRLFRGSPSKLVEVEFAMKYRYNSYKGAIIIKVAGIDLSCNKLTGMIPPELGDLHEILSLNLSHNHLSRSIPVSFSNLKSLESLDLCYNNLSGEIPSQLVVLNFLGTFNVSYNNLSGKILDKGQFGTFTESSYKGNLGLCGPIIHRSCITNEAPSIPPASEIKEEEDEGGVDMVWFYWSFSASYATILLTLIVILRINRQWRMYWFYLVDVCIYSISIRLFGTECLCM